MHCGYYWWIACVHGWLSSICIMAGNIVMPHTYPLGNHYQMLGSACLRIWSWCTKNCDIGGTKGPWGSVTGISTWPLNASHHTMHGTSYIKLIMTWMNSFCHIKKLKSRKRSSEAGINIMCIVENLGMVLQVICMATLMWWCQSG